MYKFLVFLILAVPILATETDFIEDLPDVELNPESKSGTISLSGTDTTSLFSNAIYVVPVLIFIILLDFAIFGAFATRSDDLNPVSNFFYHARRGLQIVREKSGRPGRPYNKHRYQRSIEMLGPVLDALAGAKEKYENQDSLTEPSWPSLSQGNPAEDVQPETNYNNENPAGRADDISIQIKPTELFQELLTDRGITQKLLEIKDFPYSK